MGMVNVVMIVVGIGINAWWSDDSGGHGERSDDTGGHR